MKSGVSVFLIVAIVACASLAHAGDVYDEDADMANMELFEASGMGKRLARKGAYKRALPYFRRAHKIRATYETANNLGAVELELGRYRDAAIHLRQALQLVPMGDPDAEALVSENLNDAKAHLITLSITAPEGAKIYLDDEKIGVAPLGDTVFVDPGTHIVYAASLFGHKSKVLSISGKAGTQQGVSLTIGAPKESLLGADLKPEDGPGLTLPATVAIVGASVTLASLAASIGLTVWANDLDNEADALLEQVGPSGCYLPSGAVAETCQRVASLREDQSTAANSALGMWITTGVATLGTAGVVAITHVLSQPQKPPVVLLPSAGPTHGGISLVGTW